MISLEKWKILTPLQNLPKNLWYFGKLIVAKGFKKLPKVKKIAKSGHTACEGLLINIMFKKLDRVGEECKRLSISERRSVANLINILRL